MPILNSQCKEYVLPITFDCNWNCPYCSINNSYDRRTIIHKMDILNKINKIQLNSIVTITGGEPGLCSKEDIIQYIKLIKERNPKQLCLETNGLFIKKYSDILLFFDLILYHCSENLMLQYIYPIENVKRISYVIIVTDENITNLRDFLLINNDKKFDIIPATYPYYQTGPILSNKNKNYVITNFYKNMTTDSIKRFLTEKNFENIVFLQ